MTQLTEVTHQREASTLIRWLSFQPVKVDNWEVQLSAPGSKYALEQSRVNLLACTGDKEKELMWKLRLEFQTLLENRVKR